MSQYLDKNHPDAHLDAPTPEDRLRLYQELCKGLPAIRCPACDGWGGHNLKVNAYPLPPLTDNTPENRHAYRHFRSTCFQCNGWGYVSDEKDATCEHDYSRRVLLSNCYEKVMCTKCGAFRYVDSSD